MECRKKILKVRGARALEMDFHAETDIFYPALIIELMGQPVNERPESHPLNDTEDDRPNGAPR